MKHAITLAAALWLGGCATTQYTSGADYNARTTALYTQSELDPAALGNGSVDADITRIASVEPNLAFPARFGLAYLKQGQLSTVPPEHLQAWAPLTERITPKLGAIAPVSPLIAAMVSPASKRSDVKPSDTVDSIRRGAARQHLDYVLIYEVTEKSTAENNGLAAADWSILGLFMVPSRDVEVRAAASAVLLDVRNGYPYGTASGIVTQDGVATSYGAYDKRQRMSWDAARDVVGVLARDVDALFDSLLEEVALQSSPVNAVP